MSDHPWVEDPPPAEVSPEFARAISAAYRRSIRAGWLCPNCGKAHPLTVSTCPEPKSLRARLEAGQRANTRSLK